MIVQFNWEALIEILNYAYRVDDGRSYLSKEQHDSIKITEQSTCR